MAEPQNLAPGVYRVDALRFSNFISVLLLENDDGWTLVDTGVAGSVGRIEDALASLGSGPSDLKRIFITHQHDDHTGGLKGLLEWAPHAEVGAPEHEALHPGEREERRRDRHTVDPRAAWLRDLHARPSSAQEAPARGRPRVLASRQSRPAGASS